MSFVPIMIPFFIGQPMDETTYKVLVIGIASLFLVAFPGFVYYESNFTDMFHCPIIEKKDSQAVQTWKQSCFTFEYNVSVVTPIMSMIAGAIILAIGLTRLYLEKKKHLNDTSQKESMK